jgi:hypothetical protein
VGRGEERRNENEGKLRRKGKRRERIFEFCVGVFQNFRILHWCLSQSEDGGPVVKTTQSSFIVDVFLPFQGSVL